MLPKSSSKFNIYHCHLCENKYASKAGLGQHRERVHNLSNSTIGMYPAVESGIAYNCHLCHCGYTSVHALQNHFSGKHSMDMSAEQIGRQEFLDVTTRKSADKTSTKSWNDFMSNRVYQQAVYIQVQQPLNQSQLQKIQLPQPPVQLASPPKYGSFNDESMSKSQDQSSLSRHENCAGLVLGDSVRQYAQVITQSISNGYHDVARNSIKIQLDENSSKMTTEQQNFVMDLYAVNSILNVWKTINQNKDADGRKAIQRILDKYPTEMYLQDLLA